ncbi:zf-HC2 domain-containing protein [Dysosmobacter welbionis]|nr:zf-HC2 domain-containing protein [Dysosmobacter welbionis]MCQ5045244.1 zf-HC2 domain-containing protein [Dysosmobacter welbionis]
MDQLDHDIVQDLLPLYHDGVCSDKSRAAVEEHLQTCQDCRKALEEMDTQLPTEKVAVDDAAAVKKISREWERGKWKARMKGAGIAVLVCLLLFGGWIAATEWFVFPVELENIQITNVRQLSDGRILYHFYIDDELGLRTLGFDIVCGGERGRAYVLCAQAGIVHGKERNDLLGRLGAGSGFGGVRGLGPRQRRG